MTSILSGRLNNIIIKVLRLFKMPVPELDKIAPFFSSFNPLPSLQSAATDDSEQF